MSVNRERRFYYLDRLGWPIETIKGRPVVNFIRLLVHTRRITRVRPKCLDPQPPDPSCTASP